jgi:hypothetical protein
MDDPFARIEILTKAPFLSFPENAQPADDGEG